MQANKIVFSSPVEAVAEVFALNNLQSFFQEQRKKEGPHLIVKPLILSFFLSLYPSISIFLSPLKMPKPLGKFPLT